MHALNVKIKTDSLINIYKHIIQDSNSPNFKNQSLKLSNG